MNVLRASILFLLFSIACVTANAAPIIIADSIAEFSGTQGQDGWYYGSYGVPFEASSFAELSSFDGSSWSGFESFDTPFLDTTSGSPGIDSGAWVTRRWVSGYSGFVDITGSFYDLDSGIGDGAHIRIILNGAQVYEYLDIPFNSPTPYSLGIDVSAGDILDFVIDPKFESTGDHTYFTTEILEDSAPVPEPATMLLLGGGLVGLAGIRRRASKA